MNMLPVAPFALRFTLTTQSEINHRVLDREDFLTHVKTRHRVGEMLHSIVAVETLYT